MENLANTIRLFQTGALGQAEFLERIDRQRGDQGLVLDQQNLTLCVR